jgi:signal transduction histidine kinase
MSPLERDVGPSARRAVDPVLAARCRRVASAGAKSVVAIGVVVLVGWATDVDVLASLVPGAVMMKVNTAICFILLGLSLGSALGTSRGRFVPIAGRAAAVLCAAIATAVLLQYLLGRDLGIDELIARDREGAAGTFGPGRMAPNTAVAFILFAVAAVLLHASAGWRRPARACGFVGGLLALLALVGYATGVQSFYGVPGVTQMAVPTGIAFVLLSAAVLLARPGEGATRLITSAGPGGLVVRRVLPLSIVAPFAMAVGVIGAERLAVTSAGIGRWLFATLVILFFATVTWRLAGWLDAADLARCRAEQEREALLAKEAETSHRLRELDALKDTFVSTISHELRTPLTSISGYLELLLEEPARFDAEQLLFLTTIERNADRLGRLVTDLLDVSRIDAGQIDLRRCPTDLSTLVDQAVQAVTPVAESSGVTLTTSLTADADVDGDPARLAQVVDNLLSNAVKYTDAGGHVVVTLTADRAAVVLRVADDGIGIAEDERGRLFERFFRTTAARDGAYQGTGLGLSITKAIVEAHGGTIVAEARQGRGTVFCVTVPRAVRALAA